MTTAPPDLTELWDQLPPVPCKRLCQDACANVAASITERDVIWHATGVTLPDPFEHGRLTGPCPLLGPDGACTAHDVRPLICRAFGAAQSLACPHGCTPTFGPVPDSVVRGLLHQANTLAVMGDLR